MLIEASVTGEHPLVVINIEVIALHRVWNDAIKDDFATLVLLVSFRVNRIPNWLCDGRRYPNLRIVRKNAVDSCDPGELIDRQDRSPVYCNLKRSLVKIRSGRGVRDAFIVRREEISSSLEDIEFGRIDCRLAIRSRDPPTLKAT